MRAILLLFLALMTLVTGITLTHSHALAAEEGAGEEGGESAGSAMKKALPDWFNRQSREYFTMPPFVIPVIDDNAVTRQVTMMVTIETMGIDNKDKIIANRRRLQDVFLRDIYGVLAFRRPDDQTYNTDVIQTRLRRVGDQVIGAGVIDDITVRTTYDRRLAPSPANR
jgi:hypothetical protein